jgi:carbonic anhydrase/acetyltransferase-like protein (isoleucine patch superfamily)
LDGTLLPHGDRQPEVAESAFVAPGAHVIGAVYLGEESSVWYGAVLRGDTEPIRIGARTNIQDACVLHADPSIRQSWARGAWSGTRRSCTDVRSGTGA